MGAPRRLAALSSCWLLAVQAFVLIPRTDVGSARCADRIVAKAQREIARYDASRNYCSFLFPPEWPYEARDFERLDEKDDAIFYTSPRFVRHIDDAAIAALSDHYRKVLSPGYDVLDMCSSWISHLPPENELTLGRVYGIGLNAEELSMNQALTSWIVRDLNKEPELPFASETFDAVLNAVSVDYLTQPLPVFKEMYRVLRPGGIAVCSFSNRCFPSKAVQRWLETDQVGRCTMVANYFKFSADWRGIVALDIAPRRLPLSVDWKEWVSAFTPRDPMYVVQAVK